MNSAPSFRDPDGYVLCSGERIFRCVLPHAVEDFREFLSSTVANRWIADRTLARTSVVNRDSDQETLSELVREIPDGAMLLEHEAIRFRNYPYEWSPAMLYSAGALTLKIAKESSSAGFGLKDATPSNIMFDGANPVFLDLLSFERRDPLDALWRAYAQFVRTFVYPLLASRYFGIRLDEVFLTHRDGLEPERMARLCPGWRLCLPPFLGSVTLPVLLSHDKDSGEPARYRRRAARDADEAAFLLEHLFARAERMLSHAQPGSPKSAVSRYMEASPYTAADLLEKEKIVAEALERYGCKDVLDLGCNTGHFSLMAARHTVRVVALDEDPDAVDRLWRSANESGLPILPLVVNIARPPGACGWANGEFASFLDRARGRFDCVLLLALLHHLVVTERAPLGRVLELVSELTTRLAVVEYVDPQDAQFQRIARGRDALHGDLTRESFEAAVRRRFVIEWSRETTPTRRIYVLRKSET